MTDKPALVNTPFVLIVRDGWGYNPYFHHRAYNAIELANTPVSDQLMATYPTTLIHTSGRNVGLPDETTGNSEVGHQNIGAGRIVYQEHMRITNAVRSGRFFDNEVLLDAIKRADNNGGAVHFMGIASDAGVHGVLYHLYACLEVCHRMNFDRVYVHFFTDGRDSGPYTGLGYVEEAEKLMHELGVGQVASIVGRYWGMDRDNRWERVERAYRCLTGVDADVVKVPHWGKSNLVAQYLGPYPMWVGLAENAQEAIQYYYDEQTNDSIKGDEFIIPTMIGSDRKAAQAGRIKSGDSVVFYNYRGDRPREIIRTFVLDDFLGEVAPSPDTGVEGFDRGPKLDVHFVTMTQYESALDEYVHIMFPKQESMPDIAGDVISSLGFTQVRAAETEKYPHVTFFFNDYREPPFENESRLMTQSPKVATYDKQPEMSANELCESILERLNSDQPDDFFIVNFANPDMVGHTGNLKAAIKAVETVDACVGRIVEAVLDHQGSLIVTADHGNAEQMWNPILDAPHTSHTLYQVPMMVIGEAFKGRTLQEDGRLADIMPTAFDMVGLETPKAMTGNSLLE